MELIEHNLKYLREKLDNLRLKIEELSVEELKEIINLEQIQSMLIAYYDILKKVKYD